MVEADEPAVEEAAEEVTEPAPAAINVPLFYSREADRSELDDELDEMFDELRRPAPEPKMSELDAIMLELEQGEDTRATAVLPAQDVLWQQEEAARAAARQAEEEFAQILVQHSVEAAQQTMQEQEQEQEPRDSWIDIDITDGEEEAAPETAMEEVLQVEDTLFCAEEDFSQEYVESAVQVEEEQREEPVVADETVWQAIFEDTQEIEAAAPYAYDVEVLVADEVSPQEAARIVEDYQRAVGVETEDPWLQVQQQWNIPEPQALVDGETVDPQKAEHIRQEADAIADELERETADEESLREDIDAPEGDEAFAARSQALYEKLRVVPVMVEEMPPVRQDVEIRLDDEERIADPIESADDYEIIVLDDEEEFTEEEDDIEIELYEMEEAAEEESIAADLPETEEEPVEADDEIEIELYEMEEEPAQSADDYEIIVLDDDEEIAEEEDDIEIELYEPEEESIAADLPETVEESGEADDEIEIELYEMKEEPIESADDYEIIVLDDDEEIAEKEDDIEIELYELEEAVEVQDDIQIESDGTQEAAEPVMQAAQETPEEQPPVQEETAQEQEEDDFPMDPETALRQKIMREMPESLRNSPMAARAAALMATMHRVDAESARIDRRMSALNPQNDEDETRAIYGRTSVAEELPADFDLFGDEKAAQEDVPDVIELGGVTEETAEEPAQAQADVIELGGVVEEIVEETEEAVPVLEGELFIPADDAVAMTLPEAELVRAYGYEQVETVEDVVPVVEETAQQEDALEHTRTIAREIFEQYDSMQEEEAETEPAVDSASDAAEEEQVRDHYSPMDDAQQYFVPSAVEMDLEEEGYPGEIYDEHLIAYAAQMEEIEDFDRRMQEAYREQAAQEAAQDDEETYLVEEFPEDEFAE
ncbi:MAG: hypothetical protein J6L88_08965, partial [Clostridia bacterium]|nr:hypothetical protein [Clostridia bacterium]